MIYKLIEEWKNAITNDKFLTEKHDPNCPFNKNRTYSKLTTEVSASLYIVLDSSISTIYRHDDSYFSNGKGYYEIQIKNPYSQYVGNKYVKNSKKVIKCDRIIVVYGEIQGWHIHAESQLAISSSMDIGRFKNKLKLF